MLPSRAFGRYVLIEQLGRGGMATVFRARDPEFDRDVALKVLPEELLQDPEFRARFQREARTVARLEHPAIVPVYDIGEEQGQPYLVMRYMPGGTLSQRLAKGPLSPTECVTLLGRIASALDEAHRQGMVHRDIKPTNILFDSYDKPHLADFGIVKLSQAATTLTGTGMIGTPAYMSPEQSEGRSDVGPPTDIYALGVVLFQMLTGCLPYESDTPVGMALKHIKEPIPRLREFNPRVPAALQAVIDRAMAKKPEDRFPTAAALAQALEAVASPTRPGAAALRETLRGPERLEVVTPGPKPPAPESRTLRAPRPRRIWLPVVIIAVLLGVAGLAFLLFGRGPAGALPGSLRPSPTAEALAEPTTIMLWHQEAEAENSAQYVQALADAYTALHPEIAFEVINKTTGLLREDFRTAALAGAPPDLLWTASDHVGPFTLAEIIIPVDELFDFSLYAESATATVQLNGVTWGVPISNSNLLMLYYNKALIAEPPADTDALITAAADLKAAGLTPLAYNQTEPFWAAPWLGGFGGKVFAEDGVTPTLNTPEMIATLTWLLKMKEDGIVPPESDYDGANTLFKEGKAAMIINGDWELGAYQDAFGDKLGIARIPMVSETGIWPAPYSSGMSFMIPAGLDDAKVAVVVDFITFATNKENQLDMVGKLACLPALKTALADTAITSDPYLAGWADQMNVGTPEPTVAEMSCVWDGWHEMQAVLAGSKSPADGAAAAQTAADACILTLQ